ncbi:unnamed protein product [Camellia sinensis]
MTSIHFDKHSSFLSLNAGRKFFKAWLVFESMLSWSLNLLIWDTYNLNLFLIVHGWQVILLGVISAMLGSRF